MKKLLFGAMLLAMVIVVPIPTMAAVDIHVSIPLPPPIVFAEPPEVIVIPETYVYVVPDIEADLFFWNGWWWYLWEGRWYRSRYYNRGWVYYNIVPSFYFDIDPGWRRHYRDHNWFGHRWNYERIPHHQLQQSWKSWQDNRRWERRGTWGIEGFRPRPQQQRQELRRERQEHYQQRPDVQQHQQWRQQQQERKPQVRQQERKPQVQQQERKPQVQQQERKPQLQQPKPSQPQGKPERGEGEHRK